MTQDSSTGRQGQDGGTPPAQHEHFKVQIDRQIIDVPKPLVTGRELLVLAGKIPPESFAIYEKLKGGQPRRIGLDEIIDLRTPGVERFVTLPLDQTEGRPSDGQPPRRQFNLPQEDMDWLEGLGLPYELIKEAAVLRVVVYDFPVPEGYSVDRVAVNVRIEPGYPDAEIDMAYFFPGLVRRDGRAIGALSADQFDGKNWQRWSRHRTGTNPWRPGVDCLSTHMSLVANWLDRELRKQ
jgi:hypothetical protein